MANIDRIVNAFLYFIALPFTAISFILTPLTNDTRIFIGVEHIADAYYSLPYGWDAAYEVKPIGNRILNWVLYKFATLFVPFENHYTEFGISVKIAALIILIVCCWYISTKIKIPYGFPFLFIAFACEANFGLLMSEWFAALFSLVAIALLLEENKWWFFTAGALCVCVGLLKSITALLAISVICSAMLLRKEFDLHDVKLFVAGCVITSSAFVVACLTIWPYSIGDMLMSRLVAHVGMYGPTTLLEWFWLTQDRTNLIRVLAVYCPVILVGVAAGAMVFFAYATRKNWKQSALIAAMWAAPLAIIFIQSEFIIYHYFVLIVPSVVSVALLAPKLPKSKEAILAVIATIFCGYILVNSVFGTFTQYEYTFWHQKEIDADSVNMKYNLTNESTLLYLDPGDAPYYFHANSSCHYIAPMPVERSTGKWNMSYLPQYRETKGCILSYSGRYVVADINRGASSGYYGTGILEDMDIMNKLKTEYELVDIESWEIYRRK